MQETGSLANSLRNHSAEDIEKALASLSDDECEALLYDWDFWARPEQLPPKTDWQTWLILAGRGFGKTRSGAEFVRQCVGKGYNRIGLIGPTASDARDVMIEGESGIMSVFPPSERPIYEPSKRRITFHNGAIATAYSAEEPERLRGPQHDLIWGDEVAAWKYAEAWDMAMFGLRLGDRPLSMVTTTPKPKLLVREILKAKGTAVTSGSTFDNADNLAPTFLSKIVAKYEGTRLGRQELYAELLEEAQGALWNRKMIEAAKALPLPHMRRKVVSIDPAVTANEQSDETGIVIAGVGEDETGHILGDVSGRYSPDGWARAAIKAYHEHECDRIVAEVNNGGDMVEYTLRSIDPNIPFRAVHASRGKAARAEPVSALYEQGKIGHHGDLNLLEDQMCIWEPLSNDKSPDRLDAMVWAITDLMIDTPTAWRPVV